MFDAAAKNPSDRLSQLTPREQQVLEMVVRGLSNRQIAEQLAVTVHAVKFHLAAIYRKLAVSNRTEATYRYMNLARGTRKK